MINERIGQPLMAATIELIALATRRPVSDETTRLRACAILGQVSTFHVSRERTLAALHWSEFDARRLTLIKSVVRAHTRAALLAEIEREPGRTRRSKASH